MSNPRIFCAAVSVQKGEAAELRSYVDDSSLRMELNQIVHSGDADPHSYGSNPYADASNSYDEDAQEAIDEARGLMAGDDADSDASAFEAEEQEEGQYSDDGGQELEAEMESDSDYDSCF